jgi:hypothetical protein
MTVKGRALTRRQHRVGGKLDPDVHGVRSYPAAPVPKEPETPEMKSAQLPGRPGATERWLGMDWFWSTTAGEMHLAVETDGWYPTVLTLDERQARFLRDTLNEWFPDE